MKKELSVRKAVQKIIEENESHQNTAKFGVIFHEGDDFKVLLKVDRSQVRNIQLDMVDRMNNRPKQLEKSDFIIPDFFNNPEHDLQDSAFLFKLFKLWQDTFLNNKDVHHVG